MGNNRIPQFSDHHGLSETKNVHWPPNELFQPTFKVGVPAWTQVRTLVDPLYKS